MRDIKDYEEKYKTEPCEEYQVKYRKKLVVGLLKKYKAKNILEIGCGMSPLFLDYTDFGNMCIVDPGETFIENAKRLAFEKKGEIACINKMFEDSVDDIKNLGVNFDFIVLSSLIHELENPLPLLEAVKSVMSEGTQLHINVPNANSIHRLLAKEMGLIKDQHELSDLQIKMQRNRVYDMELLEAQVKELGFKVVEKGTYFPKFLSANQMEKMLELGIVDEEIFGGLDRFIKYIPEYGSELFVQVVLRGMNGEAV